MALPTIQISDFKGSIKIVQASSSTDLAEYIDQYYTERNTSYLRKIIGGAAFDLIVSTTPLPQKYIDLLGGVTYDNTRFNQTEDFEGLTEALKRLIYFEYMRDTFKASHTGLNNYSNENSINATAVQANGYSISQYNQSSEYVKNGLLFIDEYTNQERVITLITDIGGGQLQIDVTDTTYLANADTVRINGVDLVVSNVVTNTSFEITSSLIEADNYYFDAFPEIVTYGEKSKYCTIGTIIG